MLVVLHVIVMMALPFGVAAAIAGLLALRGRSRLAAALAKTEPEKGEIELRGKLAIVGTSLQGAPAGASVAARTTWSFKRRKDVDRASAVGKMTDQAKLLLETDDGVVRLDGAEVVSGSRIEWLVGRRGAMTPFFGMVMQLGVGDRVRAFGKLIDDDEPAADDYRGEDRRRKLVPAQLGGVVRLAVDGAPIIRRRGDWRRLVTLLPAALFLKFPYGALTDYQKAGEKVAKACKSYGRCHVVPNWSMDSFKSAVTGIWKGDHFQLVAKTNADCQPTPGCQRYGACSVVNGECTTATDADCLGSFDCAQFGFCRLRVGGSEVPRCVPRDEDCRRMEACEHSGRCGSDGQTCVAKTDEDCARSEFCMSIGRCSAKDGLCAVVKDADCVASSSCRSLGKCVAKNGSCEKPTNEHEDACSADCAETGACTPKDGQCTAASDEDCRKSKACAESALCHAKNGSCVREAKERRCRDTEACRTWGRCRDDGDDCVAGDAKDCSAARVCKEGGACTPASGACIESCAKLPGCRKYGYCSLVDGHCAPTAEGCKASDDCWSSGLCSYAKGSCVALTDDDCRGSYYCRSIADCWAIGGRCESKGLTKDCALACKLRGECTSPNYDCIVSGDEDCKKSDVCAQYGWCFAASMPEPYYPAEKKLCYRTKELIKDTPAP